MPTNNHPQLTARDILEAFQQVQREILEHDISAQEGTTRYEYRWERMAQLLNERIKQPPLFVASASLSEFCTFTVQLATSTISESDAIEQALEAIYESGLDDWTKDQLRNTLSVGKEN